MPNQWHSSEHDDEPRDQDRDLSVPHLFAEVGPDSRREPDGWSWSVVTFGNGEVIEDGFAATEQEAKNAVAVWEEEHRNSPVLVDAETGYVLEVLSRYEADRLLEVQNGRMRVEENR